MDELEETLAIPREEVLLASAKEGTGVHEILEAIVRRVPPPRAAASAAPALVFDSHYDPYKGVVAYVRLAEGTLHDHDRIRFMATDAESEILELGYFRPQPVPTKRLVAEVGYVASGVKSIREARVGDTLTSAAGGAPEPLPGYRGAAAARLRRHLPAAGRRLPRAARRPRQAPPQRRRLRLPARVVGGPRLRVPVRLPRPPPHGDRQERLEREFDLDLIASAPSVEYRAKLLHRAEPLVVDNPAQMPDPGQIESISRAVGAAQVITPTEYIGPLMELAAPAAAASSRTWSTSTRTGSTSTSRCRSASSSSTSTTS